MGEDYQELAVEPLLQAWLQGGAPVTPNQPLGSGLDGLEGHPKLIAWLARVKKELGERLFDEAHDALMKSDSLPQKLLNNKEFDKLKLMFQKSVR